MTQSIDSIETQLEALGLTNLEQEMKEVKCPNQH